MIDLMLHTLADLAERQVIYALCDPCRRSVCLNTRRLIALYGADLTLASLKYRLTCRVCRARPRQIRIVYTIPPR